MLVALSKSIKSDINKRSHANVDFNQYVELIKDFLPNDYLDDAIIAEVEELGLFKNSNKPLTQWLSSDSRNYCFSDNKRPSHPSKDIRKYHNICKLMDTVNKDTKTTQNADAALVIVYNTKHAGIDFHNDGEKLIDSSSSISTITFGSSRDIEFCNQGIRPRVAQHTVEAGNHDLMIMKPGCQEQLVHRVCQGTSHQNTNDEWRVVISFRKITQSMEQDSEISFNKDDDGTSVNTQSTVTSDKIKRHPLRLESTS
ncbi:MAG: alpha-ketoglutarate-dependent dioxygenase AlkB [Saccharospirillaceae bacterium]|nr:alpha-ketoglutarate-dependent dioxygenase AlkB [Saccharospirillaceae bacterium]